MIYVVEVEWSTQDDLMQGKTCVGTSTVEVEAFHGGMAQLLAAQLVATNGRVPTRSRFAVTQPVVDPGGITY